MGNLVAGEPVRFGYQVCQHLISCDGDERNSAQDRFDSEGVKSGSRLSSQVRGSAEKSGFRRVLKLASEDTDRAE